jgi:hypothetical protein
MAAYDNADTLTTLNGIFKNIYSNKGLQDLIPEEAQLQKLITFEDAEKLGSQYVVPLTLAAEWGITYGGSAGDFYQLNDTQSMTVRDATVVSCSHILRSGISYDAASRAAKGGDQAFVGATTTVMGNMLKNLYKILEIEMLYGQAATGQGAVASVNSITSTTMTLTIASGEWSAGLWSGSLGKRLDFINSSNNTVVNSAGPLKVIAINLKTNMITVSGASADVTAITALYGASGTGYVTGYKALGNEFAGLNRIFTNTGSLFGLDASAYELLQSNQFAVGGNLTLDAVGDGLALAQARGLSGPVDLFVNPMVWKQLQDQSISQRVFDSSYNTKTAESGSENIKYHTQSGVVTVHSHLFVKTGEAYAFNANDLARVGSSKAGFNAPGGVQGQIMFHAPNNAGFEIRAYADEAMISLKPAACTIFTGITL